MSEAFIQLRPGEVAVHAPQQFYAGDDWPIEIECTDPAGTPLDLNGATISWLLNRAIDESNVLALTIGDGITLEENASGDLIAGMALVRVDSSRTVTLEPGYYLDELTVTTAAGETTTQLRGRIQVLAKLSGSVSG